MAKAEPSEYPPGYTKVRSFIDLFRWIGEELVKDRDAKLVWILDEAGIAFGSLKPVMVPSQRAIVYLAQLSRKFNLNQILITTSPKMMLKALRSADTGFLGATFSKIVYDIQKYARHLLEERDMREIFVLRWPEQQLHEDDVLPMWIEGVTELPWCKPVEFVEMGEVVLSSKAPATFIVGFFPGTKVAFDVELFLDYISDEVESETPALILHYLDKKGYVENLGDGRETYTEAKAGSTQHMEDWLPKVSQMAERLESDGVPLDQWAKTISKESKADGKKGFSQRTAVRYLQRLGMHE